jgi:hypothetical protein
MAAATNVQVKEILYPFVSRKIRAMKNGNRLFVHYTTAENAVRIISNGEIWLRNARTMNDFREVEYGVDCLMRAYGGAAGGSLLRLMDELYAGSGAELDSRFKAWIPGFHWDTFLLCISEHHMIRDQMGRLSMWRAYASENGVALVLNKEVFRSNSDGLKAYISPVRYSTESTFDAEFSATVAGMRAEVETLRQLAREDLINHVFHALRYACVCTKHPGFAEEKEWRVIHSPALAPSDRVKIQVEPIRGLPQHVAKIKLEDDPESGFVGANPDALINRIILGPCQHPNTMRRALVDVMDQKRMANAMARVFSSDIPLRT